jgi:hypothetical protein
MQSDSRTEQNPVAQREDQMAPGPDEEQFVSQQAQRADRNESGSPGGGVGRIDAPGHTGVYPLSADQGASPEAVIEPEHAWGQGALGVEGYEESGDSGITPPERLGATGDEVGERQP